LDVAIDFDSCLSGGERQRLGFARLLLKRPQLDMLDGVIMTGIWVCLKMGYTPK
jgi:ABC-type uncharacterized transport system fused permease/ATPase subunit